MIALLPSALAFLGGGYNNVAAGKGGRRFTGATRQLPSPSLDDVTLESGAKIRNKIYPFLKGYMVKNIEFCEVSKRPLVCGAGVVVPPHRARNTSIFTAVVPLRTKVLALLLKRHLCIPFPASIVTKSCFFRTLVRLSVRLLQR